MNAVLTALAAIIAPLENWAEQKLSSIGAALLSGFGVILNGLAVDVRSDATALIAYWQSKYAAAIAAGASELDAVEQASTATANQFLNDLQAEGAKELQAVLTLLESSVKNNLAS